MPKKTPRPTSENETTPTSVPAVILSTELVLGRAQTTLKLIREVVQESSAEHWFGIGMDRIEDERYSDAIAAFIKCIELDATDRSPHWEIIICKKLLGDYAGAVLHYLQLIELWPNTATYIYQRLGEYQENEINDLQAALESCNKSIAAGEPMLFEKRMLHWTQLSREYDILARSYRIRARVREKLGDLDGSKIDKDAASALPSYEWQISPFQMYRRNYILY